MLAKDWIASSVVEAAQAHRRRADVGVSTPTIPSRGRPRGGLESHRGRRLRASGGGQFVDISAARFAWDLVARRVAVTHLRVEKGCNDPLDVLFQRIAPIFQPGLGLNHVLENANTRRNAATNAARLFGTVVSLLTSGAMKSSSRNSLSTREAAGLPKDCTTRSSAPISLTPFRDRTCLAREEGRLSPSSAKSSPGLPLALTAS